MASIPAGLEPSTLCVPRSGEPGGVCSGRGICVQFPNGTSVDNVRAFCICESGWSPIGDFATDPSVDCGINVMAQRILWGIAAVPHLALLLMSVWRLGINRRSLSLKQVNARAFGLNAIYGALMLVACLLEAANSTPGARSIGIDPLTTTLFVLGSSAFFIMFYDYNATLLRVAVRQARLTTQDKNPINEKQAKCMQTLMPISGFFNVLACFFAFGFLAENPSEDQIWGSLHYLCFVVGVFVLIILSELVISPLRDQVLSMQRPDSPNSSSDSRSVKRVILTLDNMIRELRVNAVVNTIINLLMGCVPFLLRKVSYQMPVAWFLIGIGAIDSFRHLGQKVKDSGSRSDDAGVTPAGGVTGTSSGRFSPRSGNKTATAQVYTGTVESYSAA